ncbi:MAG: carboxypeptidase regulatory-like domain-containing protein [Planctomycetes bacterium]|nr:carboxypeptidase regulatory-like domain-containing protein [Planctomycetota bacterium]
MQSPCATILRLTCVALFLAVHGAVLTQQARTREPKIRQATRIGRVVDPAEGAIADAELRLIDSATQNVIASARTRDSGAFALDVSAVDERTTLVVMAKDFAERRLSSDELQRTGTLLRLRPAATMTGRVTDGQKRPIAGASIVVAFETQNGSEEDFRWTASTDGQGNFEVAGVPLGTFHVAIGAEGYRYLDAPTIWSGKTRCDFVLETGEQAPYSVVVRDLDGRPLAGCEVRVHTFPQRGFAAPLPPRLARGVTDANGTWSARGPEALDYRITVHREGYQESIEQSVSLGQRVRERTFTMRPLEELPLRGHVVDADGKALSELVVHVFDKEDRHIGTAKTDEKGAFETTTKSLRLEDRFRFALPAMPHALGPLRLPSHRYDPERDYVLEVRPTAAIRGRAFGADGSPAAHQIVWLCTQLANARPLVDSGWQPWFWVMTDRRGNFEFVGGVPPGFFGGSPKMRLETHGNAGWGNSDPFELDGAGALPKLEIRCERAACVRGKVVDKNGIPLGGIRLKFKLDKRTRRTKAHPGFETAILTSHDGTFVLSGLAPRDYFVFYTPPFEAKEYGLTAFPLILKSGQTLDVELVVR